MFKGGRVNEEGKCHLKTRASRPRPADRVWGWRHSELRAERKHRWVWRCFLWTAVKMSMISGAFASAQALIKT